MDIFQELTWRELLDDYTGRTDAGTGEDGLPARLRSGPLTLYCGFDPTADSLHAGSLVPLLALRRFQLAGHHPIAVAGGATGSIGDPSGKSQERQLLTKDRIAANVQAIRPQLARLLDFEAERNPARLVDNADWLGPVSFLDFLRDVGKHFTVNQMVAKESVRARMEDREAGISYTEFSYMLLQAYDFHHLARVYGCELQIGGSDQWGNITAGMELIRRKLDRRAWGLTLPLITKADGTKFGKTESGTVWLDPKRTSVYQFYQFWINTDDRDAVRYLKYFTFLSQEEIAELEKAHAANPGAREAHQALAKAVTSIVHGEASCMEAVRASAILFGGSLDGITPATLDILLSEVPAAAVPAAALSNGLPLVEALMAAGLSTSKSQARKDIDGGGIYINGQRCQDNSRSLTTADLLHERAVLLRKGKRLYALLSLLDPLGEVQHAAKNYRDGNRSERIKADQIIRKYSTSLRKDEISGLLDSTEESERIAGVVALPSRANLFAAGDLKQIFESAFGSQNSFMRFRAARAVEATDMISSVREILDRLMRNDPNERVKAAVRALEAPTG